MKPSTRTPAVRRGTPNSEAPSRYDILEAALKVFAKKSFEGAALQDIAQLANIGQPLLHYHFGSKENLWRSALEYALSDFKQVFQFSVASTVDLEPIDAIRVFCRTFMQFAAQKPESMIIAQVEMREAGERFEWLAERYLRPVHHHLDTLITKAIELGQIRPIPPEHLTITILINLSHFYVAETVLGSMYGIRPRDPVVAADHIEYIMGILFHGIQMPPEEPVPNPRLADNGTVGTLGGNMDNVEEN